MNTTATPTQPVCPRCRRRDIRYRAEDGTYGCRICGHRWPKQEEAKQP